MVFWKVLGRFLGSYSSAAHRPSPIMADHLHVLRHAMPCSFDGTCIVVSSISGKRIAATPCRVVSYN